MVPPVSVVADAVNLFLLLCWSQRGKWNIISSRQTIFTIPSPKSVACLSIPFAEKSSFNCVATKEEISAVVLFCGSAELAVKEIPDDAVVPVVMAAVNVDNVIEGELLNVNLTSPALVSYALYETPAQKTKH